MTKMTVTGFDLGFSNSALRMPYALATLACGHVVAVTLRDRTGICCGCGVELTCKDHESFTRCACGTYMATHISRRDPHNEADRLTKVGDVVECATCDKNVEQVAWLRALPKGLVHHARFDPRFAPGSYHLYTYDATSPSCFFLVGSVPATPAFDAVLREVGISPISPTECA